MLRQEERRNGFIVMFLESCFPDAKMERRVEFAALGLYIFSLRYLICGEY